MSLSNSIKLNSNKRVHTKVIGLVILLVLLNFQGYKEGEGHWQAITVRGKLDLQKKNWLVVNRAGGRGFQDNGQLAVNWDKS